MADDAKGSAIVPVRLAVNLPATALVNEIAIDLAKLGLTGTPDSVAEISGNARLLHASKPPEIKDGSLHVHFDPPLAGGTSYGFQFNFVYDDAVEVV
ncbi:MAG: hypothetical protein ABWZ64_05485 [Xanthobacteraceae bacterium]